MKRSAFLKSMAWAATILMYGWRTPEEKPTDTVELWGLFDEGPDVGLVWRHGEAAPENEAFGPMADLLDGWKTAPAYVRSELVFRGALTW